MSSNIKSTDLPWRLFKYSIVLSGTVELFSDVLDVACCYCKLTLYLLTAVFFSRIFGAIGINRRFDLDSREIRSE